MPKDIRDAADHILETDQKLVVRAYGVIHSTEDFLRNFVRKVTEKFARADLAPVLEIVVKELMMNAAKANFKRIFFTENNIDANNHDDYRDGMQRFRDVIDENIFTTYGLKARDAKLTVEASFDFNQDRIVVEVRNNSPMTAIEEARVREKLKRGYECADMGEFLLEHMDETEGAGAGLALCVTAMRSAGLDPRLLSLATHAAKETVARVEVPFHAAYVPTRTRYQSQLAG